MRVQDAGGRAGARASIPWALAATSPIFSSSAISGALGLFQLPGEEEVSGRAQPDDIYFHGGREPPRALCAHPALWRASAAGGPGSAVIHREGSTAVKSWRGIGTG